MKKEIPLFLVTMLLMFGMDAVIAAGFIWLVSLIPVWEVVVTLKNVMIGAGGLFLCQFILMLIVAAHGGDQW